MTLAKHNTVDPRENDRKERAMMKMGSKLLLDSLRVRHPRIIRVLQGKQGLELED